MKNEKPKYRVFDPINYLTSEGVINEYLNLAIESGDPDELMRSLGNVARARGGINQLARNTGLGRQNLYRALRSGGRPRIDTVLKVMQALGVSLHAQAQEPRKAA